MIFMEIFIKVDGQLLWKISQVTEEKAVIEFSNFCSSVDFTKQVNSIDVVYRRIAWEVQRRQIEEKVLGEYQGEDLGYSLEQIFDDMKLTNFKSIVKRYYQIQIGELM